MKKYQEKLSIEWQRLTANEDSEAVLTSTGEVCGMQKVEVALLGKGNEQWDDEVKLLMKEIREVNEYYLQRSVSNLQDV